MNSKDLQHWIKNTLVKGLFCFINKKNYQFSKDSNCGKNHRYEIYQKAIKS